MTSLSKSDLQARLNAFKARSAASVDQSVSAIKVVGGGAIAGVAHAKMPSIMGVEGHVGATLLSLGLAIGSGNRTLMKLSEGMAAYTLGTAIKDQLSQK